MLARTRSWTGSRDRIKIILTGTGVMISVLIPHFGLQPCQLVFQILVLPEQILHHLVTILLALELIQLALQPLDVLLRPCPDGTLGLTVIRPLPG